MKLGGGGEGWGQHKIHLGDNIRLVSTTLSRPFFSYYFIYFFGRGGMCAG